jgi:hypothetical protein
VTDETETHKLECFARWMIKNMTRKEIEKWLSKSDNEDIMRDKLNQALKDRKA